LMGGKPAKLRSEVIDELVRTTPFTEQEVHEWYHGFLKDCPAGQLTIDDFQRIYTTFFPYGDAKPFARYVFRAFDKNGDGIMEFREFLTTLSIISRGKLEEKLKWAFSVYDLDGDGFISRGEMTDVIKASYRKLKQAPFLVYQKKEYYVEWMAVVLSGIKKQETFAEEVIAAASSSELPPGTHLFTSINDSIYLLLGSVVKMPESDATPEQRTNRVFELMDKDRDYRISLEEFLEGVQADPDVLQLLKLDTMTLGVSATTGSHEHNNNVDPVMPPQQQPPQPTGKGAATT
uniref:Neurocalcin homolog n=1 Tax=Schistocephalus solidus TaxID=70667 RepID=A0A183T769_SCHSO